MVSQMKVVTLFFLSSCYLLSDTVSGWKDLVDTITNAMVHGVAVDVGSGYQIECTYSLNRMYYSYNKASPDEENDIQRFLV